MIMMAHWKTKQTIEWSCDDVVAWLISVNHDKEAALFKKEEIDGEALLNLTNDDLKEILTNISIGVRVKIRTKIEKLN